MSTIAEALTDLVRAAAEAAGHTDAPIPLEPCVATNDPRHGDYQSNFAFRLGKALRTNPRQVASDLVAKLPASPMVAGVDVAGPGFINFRLADEWLAEDIATRAFQPDLGAGRPGAGKVMVIDYSSPNIAKRMHVGHLRSTIIGDAIKRLYQHLGWDVVADNHVGDWGTQFGKLIVAWDGWRDDAAYEADPIGELQRIYQLYGDRSAEDPSLDDRARAETAKLQAGDPDNRSLWEQFVRASMLEFDRLYARLDVHFDVTLGESFYRDGLDEMVERHLASGLAEVDDGAVIIRFDPSDGKGLGKSPMLIRKRDGAALYGTTDLATLAYRDQRWTPEKVVYVTDIRQALHFRQVFAAARKIGYTGDLEHVTFGMLRFADGAVAASRSGRTLNLVDVLDTAAAHARKIVDENARDIPEEERAAIAEAVGVGAVKYTDLSQNPKSDIIFDWDKMLAMEGNTAPYLMYARARCQSIFRRGEIVDFEPGGICLETPEERALAVALARTPEVIRLAAETWRPNLLCEHLFSVGQAFSRFFANCPVLTAEGATRQSRLTLVAATAQVLGLGLGLLGLQSPDRM